MRVFLFSLLAIFTISACAAPCTGVDRSLDQNRKKQLAPVIAKQLNITSADILQSFKYQSWYIIFVETHVSDEPYLFFKGDPFHEKYLTLWSGAARADEEQQIKEWTIRNVKGIPLALASCFAWHVTKNR